MSAASNAAITSACCFRCSYAGRKRMPFDGTVFNAPKPLSGADGNLLGLAVRQPSPSSEPRLNRRSETVASTLAVLTLARDLIAEERRWCKGAFARNWFHIPVRVGSGMARRYCALGATLCAAYQLGLGVDGACAALECQVGRRVQHWNDDPARTHAEVIAAF